LFQFCPNNFQAGGGYPPCPLPTPMVGGEHSDIIALSRAVEAFDLA